MTDQTHDFATTTEMMDRLAAAAWDALATTAPRDLSLATIAADAAIDAGAARAIAGNVTTLILHRLSQLDQLAILESFADIADAGDVTIREKIMEAITHRFEIYNPYKAQVAQLEMAARRDPELGIRLLDNLVQAIRRILIMAGDDVVGWRGEARVRGVAAVSLLVARVWRDDESADLSITMNEIDKRLAQGEEWGRSLRVFDTGTAASTPSPSFDADQGDDSANNPADASTAYDDKMNMSPDERYQ